MTISRSEFEKLKMQFNALREQLDPLGQGIEAQWDENDFLIGTVLRKLQRFRGFFWFCNNWLPAGMISSGVTGTGIIRWYDNFIELATGPTLNSHAYVLKRDQGFFGQNWDKNRWFGVQVDFSQVSNQYIHFVSGGIELNSIMTNLDPHIGFKIENATLYATVANDTTESTLNLGPVEAKNYILECHLKGGRECRFYKNGIDVGNITTNLPFNAAPAYADWGLHATICNTAAADKVIRFWNVRVYQEE